MQFFLLSFICEAYVLGIRAHSLVVLKIILPAQQTLVIFLLRATAAECSTMYSLKSQHN